MIQLDACPEELKLINAALSQMETEPSVCIAVGQMVSELRAIGTTITFDRVLIHLGSRKDQKGASVFAALVVREDCRQRIAAALAATPAYTAH